MSDFNPESVDMTDWTPGQREEFLALAAKQWAKIRPKPTSLEGALALLQQTAKGDTGGSQAVRNFLFWMAGQPDPTGYEGFGGIELRRLDSTLKSAALTVLDWWAGPTQSDAPLYEVLDELRETFGVDHRDDGYDPATIERRMKGAIADRIEPKKL